MRKKTILFIAILVTALCAAFLWKVLQPQAFIASFSDAMEIPGVEVTITGHLDKAKPINKKLHSFFARDKHGMSWKVLLSKELPQDFERADQLAIIGYYSDDQFHANDVLVKCVCHYKAQQERSANINSKGAE